MESDAILFDQGMKFYHDRNLTEAEGAFRQILMVNPRHAHSLHMMAAIGYEVERYDFAESLARMAIEEQNDVADFYFTLGSILNRRKNFEEALVNFQKATQLKPDHFNALVEMATICRNQGLIFRKSDMIDAALNFFTRALSIRPEEEVYYNIGYIYQQQGRYREAIAISKSCAERYPDTAKSWVNIAVVHDSLREFEQALEYFQKAILIEPNNGTIYANMASTLKNMGRVEESIAMQRKAIELSPDKPWMYNNILLTMVYAASVSPEELANESRQFGKNIADPLMRQRPFTNDRKADRKLRVGYVSPDFREHPVNYFLAPIYNCDKENFEIYAYSKNDIDDAVTTDLKKYFDHWNDIKYASDDAAADLIEADQIDILVDLAGHTARNGLMIFARKPAPIQVTWLGHPATTGMKAMDYRITDSYAEPPGMTEHLNTEQLWRMPEIFCAYTPHENSPDVIDHPPFEDNGYITFGCFNNFTKMTDNVFKTWAIIMTKIPDSRLLLEVPGIESAKIRTEIEQRLTSCGLPMDRVMLEPRTRSNQFILYNKIDIALDPFPCVGGTTSMDTLWMGVPFVTIAGNHFASRMGVSILTNVGLPELIAKDIDDYISISVNLAQDRKRLIQLRYGLRERAANSPLMDQKRFTKNIEEAYRQMWRKWTDRI